jgi:hypothetical protein
MAYSLRTLDQQHTVVLQHSVTTVGSHPSSTLPVHPGFGLAPEQFSILMSAQGHPWLEDRSGIASTLINGRPVQQQQLVHGDIISAGQLSLIFVGEELLQQQRQANHTAAVPQPVQRPQTSAVPSPAVQQQVPAAYTGAVPPPAVQQVPAAYTGAVPPPAVQQVPAAYTGAVPPPAVQQVPAAYTGAVPPPAVQQVPAAYTGAVPPPAVQQVPAAYTGAVPPPAVVTGYVPQLDHSVVAAALTPEAREIQSSGQPTSLPPLSEKSVAEAMLSLRASNRPVFFDPAANNTPLPELPNPPKVTMKELLEQFINAQTPPVPELPHQPQERTAANVLPTVVQATQIPHLPAKEATASVAVSAPLKIPAIPLDGIKTLSNSSPLPAIRQDPAPMTAPLTPLGKKKSKKLLLSGGLIGVLTTVAVLATKLGYLNLPWLSQLVGGH